MKNMIHKTGSGYIWKTPSVDASVGTALAWAIAAYGHLVQFPATFAELAEAIEGHYDMGDPKNASAAAVLRLAELVVVGPIYTLRQEIKRHGFSANQLPQSGVIVESMEDDGYYCCIQEEQDPSVCLVLPIFVAIRRLLVATGEIKTIQQFWEALSGSSTFAQQTLNGAQPVLLELGMDKDSRS